jgi:hypothetical protein
MGCQRNYPRTVPIPDSNPDPEAGFRVVVFLPLRTIKEIERQKGLASRSAFIRNLVEKGLNLKGGPK